MCDPFKNLIYGTLNFYNSKISILTMTKAKQWSFLQPIYFIFAYILYHINTHCIIFKIPFLQFKNSFLVF